MRSLSTGVDEGLRGEPRNVGLVAHEIGTWTSSEEMVNADGSSSDQAKYQKTNISHENQLICQSYLQKNIFGLDSDRSSAPDGYIMCLFSV